MNGSESALWSTVHDGLSRYGYLKRVENAIDTGTPDVAYCLRPSPVRPAVSGWLELKHADAWPARSDTPLALAHLTLEQVLFVEGWRAAGGRAHVLLQVARDYLLLRASTVRRLYRRELPRAVLVQQALLHHTGAGLARPLLRCLVDRGEE